MDILSFVGFSFVETISGFLLVDHFTSCQKHFLNTFSAGIYFSAAGEIYGLIFAIAGIDISSGLSSSHLDSCHFRRRSRNHSGEQPAFGRAFVPEAATLQFLQRRASRMAWLVVSPCEGLGVMACEGLLQVLRSLSFVTLENTGTIIRYKLENQERQLV